MRFANCPKCGSSDVTTAGVCANCGWIRFPQVTVSSGVYKTIGELEIKVTGKALLDDYKRLLFENKSLESRIAELEEAYMKAEDTLDDVELAHAVEIGRRDKRIAELSQAVGLITTLKPTMVMDADHPLDMAKEVEEYVTSRIAELEAENDQLTAHDATERQDNKWIQEVQK